MRYLLQLYFGALTLTTRKNRQFTAEQFIIEVIFMYVVWQKFDFGEEEQSGFYKFFSMLSQPDTSGYISVKRKFFSFLQTNAHLELI